jgi:hypothetical protein
MVTTCLNRPVGVPRRVRHSPSYVLLAPQFLSLFRQSSRHPRCLREGTPDAGPCKRAWVRTHEVDSEPKRHRRADNNSLEPRSAAEVSGDAAVAVRVIVAHYKQLDRSETHAKVAMLAKAKLRLMQNAAPV